jgi:ataxia telangiectasia mutated family protein
MPGGLVSQAWQRHLNTEDVIRYLLLLDGTPTAAYEYSCSSCAKYAEVESIIYCLDNAHFHSARKLILELISPKCRGLLQSWKLFNADRSSPISPDAFRSATYSSITMLLSTSYFFGASLPQSNGFETELLELSDALLTFVTDAENRDSKGAQPLVEVVLQAVQPYLPSRGSGEFSQLSKKCPHTLRFFVMLAEYCSRRRLAVTSSLTGADEDLMDLDEEFSTQQSNSRMEAQKAEMPRSDLALEMSSVSFHFVITERLTLLAAMEVTPDLTGFLPSTFVDHLLSLSDEELLSSRPLLGEIFNSDLVVDSGDASRLIRHLGGILSSTEFDRCEVTLGLCLDILVGLGSLWASTDAMDDLAEPASQIYRWFIDVALDKGIASPAVQIGISRLLLLLMEIEPTYGVALSMPSPRSSLFNLLQTSNAAVKFYIGNRLPEVFANFVLKDHDSIFVDILNNLPSQPDWIEGISFRLHVLARLASRWSTLLRRCIYHIFETPGKIRESINHATRCLEDVSSALKVDSPRELFDLFAPQILYTWLESEDIDDIPFQIFGFSSLQDLVIDAQEEAVALMIMRGQDAGVEQLTKILATDEVSLVQKSFSKVIAYTVAHDMSVKSSSNGTKHTTGEARVKHCLGKERLFENYSLHFADIMVVVFNIMDQEVNVEKHFLKKEESMYAAKILKDIKDLSSSGTALPANQQPMFSAKHLTREIEYMCLRTQYEPHSLYSPTMVVFIARRLLNTVHPALGSLHACSVLRKVRILIALAGDAAVAGYPLEMLLQSIRPFLNDQECADDAIGVIQYLLSRGLEHLSQIPSFIAGISLSIVGSLRIFLRSSQSSTTQESQFRTTRSKAGRFRSWFEKYLKTYSSPSLNTEARKNFAKIVESAFGTQSAGNAELGSAQSKLLLLLLQDEKAGESLLSRPSRELALNMLCSEFQIPTSFRQDVLGDDELSIANAVVVWKSCRVDSVSKQYLSWAARVLGRAFASSGQIHQELLQESTLQNINGLSTATEEDGDSRAYVLSILQELTLGHDRHTVGLAEAALRVILSTQDESLFQTCQKNLAAPIHAASTWEPYHLPPSESPNHSTGAESLDDRLSDEAIMRQHWLRDLSIELARSVQDDCLLLSLIPLLRRVSVFAEQVFPFILHLVLSTPSQSTQQIRKKLSNAFVKWLGRGEHVNKNNLKTILNAVLYLRTQPLPNEKSSADRPHWLDIDYSRAAAAAASCGMFKTALLFVEDSCAEPAKTSRRSSMRDSLESSNMHTEMLLTIFQNIDDPDMYYGVQQNAGLRTVLARFEYEKDGPKSLAFRGAQYDSHIRRRDPESSQDVQSLVKALDVLSLSGLSHSLLQSQQNAGVSATSLESMFRTARKLEQWDIPVPQASSNNAVTLYKAYQTVNTAVERATISRTLDEGFECIMSTLVREDLSASALHSSLQTLAALVEMDEVYSSQGSEQYEEMLERFEGRTEWMKIGRSVAFPCVINCFLINSRFDDISQILSCRGTTLSSLSQHPRLQEVLNIPAMDTRLVEVRTALLASKINRAHNALQESLSSATSMIDLIKPCVEVGLNVEVAIHLEAANALWDQGEMVSSINMLRALDNGANLKNQTIAVGRSDLLSKIGHQVSVARLEKADTILEKYLKPALKELKGKVNGHEAGQVFHQFAVFCDEQLQDPDSLEDLERLRKLSKHKRDEVEGYDKLISTSTSSTDKRDYEQDRRKAKTWLKLDEEELQRHNSSRDEFLRHCLENYLLALSASDDHDSNSLRFSSLWLEHSEDSLANNAVSKHLPEVPSRKLAPLMNQLSSRLQDSNVKFQQLLFSLVLRICSEHPYHGMYQIYAGVKNKPNPKDEAAVSRNRATAKLSKQLQLGGSGQIWVAINVTNDAYCRLAAEKDDRYKSGKRVALKDSIATMRLNETLRKCKIPPPTMQVDIAANLDYSKVPKMHRFESQISIASGVSAPKIITALADNGARFKQLVSIIELLFFGVPY